MRRFRVVKLIAVAAQSLRSSSILVLDGD